MSSLTANAMQQGVHAASHLYARATEAVSLVPHIYYASYASRRASAYRDSFTWAEGAILHPAREELAEAEAQARPAVLPMK